MKVKVIEAIANGKRFTTNSFVKNINRSEKNFTNKHLCYAKYLKRFIKYIHFISEGTFTFIYKYKLLTTNLLYSTIQ